MYPAVSRQFVTALIMVALTCAATAQLPGNSAGPRPGVIHELTVTWSGPDFLRRLSEAGYNVDHVQPGIHAKVYATPEERDQLAAAGYAFVEAESVDTKTLGVYSTYASLTADLQAYAAAHTSIARLYSIGQSVQGREMWALLITDNPDIEEVEPEFKYISTMHGDEPVGTEMSLYLIDRLLNDYGVDSRITDLVNETAIWFVPLMNPDGLEMTQRNNANGFDLNRSFPQYPVHFTSTLYDGEALGTFGRQPEVANIMQWSADNSFVLAANFHTGALVVNYLYDNDPGILSGDDAPSPDDLLFEDISLRYSSNNGPMFGSIFFTDGITNGSDWFSNLGGMQDWNYRFLGCGETTIELSMQKTPPQGTLPGLWSNNEESMLQYIEAVHIGARGVITDQDTGAPLNAQVTVMGNPQRVFTDPDLGDYYRLLLPGTYMLTYEAEGYYPETHEVTVTAGPATVLNVPLEAIGLGLSRWTSLLLAIMIALAASHIMARRRGA